MDFLLAHKSSSIVQQGDNSDDEVFEEILENDLNTPSQDQDASIDDECFSIHHESDGRASATLNDNQRFNKVRGTTYGSDKAASTLSRMKHSDKVMTSANANESACSSSAPTHVEKVNKRKVKVKLSMVLQDELLYEAEGYLLDLVFARPPLFDYTTPVVQRNPENISRLWHEVHQRMTDHLNMRIWELMRMLLFKC